jgi:hypothetical protein
LWLCAAPPHTTSSFYFPFYLSLPSFHDKGHHQIFVSSRVTTEMSLPTTQTQEDIEQGRNGVKTPGGQKPKDRKFMSSFSRIAGTKGVASANSSFPSGLATTPDDLHVFRAEQFEAHLRRVHGATVFSFDDSSLTINLASLHRIELLKLQRQLLREALDFRYRRSATTSVSATSHTYSKIPKCRF